MTGVLNRLLDRAAGRSSGGVRLRTASRFEGSASANVAGFETQQTEVPSTAPPQANVRQDLQLESPHHRATPDNAPAYIAINERRNEAR